MQAPKNLSDRHHIRSYVKRGRITAAQKNILATHQHLLITPDQLTNQLAAIHQQHHFTQTVVEIGFGNGESLAFMAQHNPQHLFLGIEVHLPGIARLLNQIIKQNLPNILIVAGDAYLILKNHLKHQSIDRLQIFFPDPWPKKAHHKRRLISPNFIDIALQTLKTRAILHIATDWQPYAEVIIQLLNKDKRLTNTSEGFADKPGYRPITKFEQAGLTKKHQSFDIVFEVI